MKKTVLAGLIILATISINIAQNQIDALRFSQFYWSGTARSNSMANSFGALGGDVSILATNPAGMSIYRKGELTFTPGLYFTETKSKFAGSNSIDSKYNFNVDNAGLVISFNDENTSSAWKGAAFGFAYNRINNFNQQVLIEGINDKGSFLDVLMYNSDGMAPESLTGLEGYAYDQYLLNVDDPDELLYINDFYGIYNQKQQKVIDSRGGMGEFSFAFSANYNDMLYIGGTMGIVSANYKEISTFSEYDVNDVSDLNHYDFKENLDVSGTGINFKLGLLFRPVDFLRFGVAFHTPTFFSMTDKYYYSLDSYWDTPDNDGIYHYTDMSDENVSEYDLTTPFRAIGSFGLVINKFALISAEYEFVDYSNARMRADDYDYNKENQNISDMLQATSNFRGGLELLFGPFAFRGGLAYYGNPYSNEVKRLDASRLALSGGLGINSGHFYMDASYTMGLQKNTNFLYDNVGEPTPELTMNMNKFMVTFGIRF